MDKLSQDDSTDILLHHGIRPTAVRILMYKEMQKFRDTFSMTDLEDSLESVDKSTIFRTLTLFARYHLVHEIEDGSGSKKYCLCHSLVCSLDELHCHFYCESCHKTFCLDHTHIPIVRYPQGFELQKIDYLLRGLCPVCRQKKAE
ncbi:MAG: transcriptional repressor [Porphyromonadaceae bacterium]|nr:transcriptional repressor [Porphyromonadaceae bacterium]